MKKIDKFNKIFGTEEFIKDKYKFNLISLIVESDEALLISDEENYVLARSAVGLPTWIWTKDGISREKVLQIIEALNLYLTDNEKDKFTCKKELYDYFLQENLDVLNKDDYFEMGFLCCDQAKKPRETDGFIDTVTEEDIDVITNYWYLDCKEMDDYEEISIEQARIDAKEMIESGNLFVWKNKDNKIVCMATYKETNGQARVGHVFTSKDERGKAYAANLIYEITKIVLDKGLVPLLYTDYNYVPSNKAYINAGYEDKGILINFSCSKLKEDKN
ncbi:MAG: hypothetical protein IJE89_04650 [Bacilli bacterium]|nr:hypothetical protein [Bacilli bacterium]